MYGLTVPVLITIIGLLMFALATNPKTSRIGEIMFFCGLLVVLMGSGAAIKAFGG